MNNKYLAAILAIGASVAVSSCDTPTGRGAAIGAGTGAVVAGPIGAAVGAASGALIGATVEETRASEYGPVPSGGYPVARHAGKPGLYYSPYTQKVYDLSGVRHGGLVRDVDTNHLFRKP